MNRKEWNEGFANYAYHHSETLEMDRSAQGISSTFHTAPLHPPYPQNPLHSPGDQRRWEPPEMIPMRSIDRETSRPRPPFFNMDPPENETGYDNAGFVHWPDDSYDNPSSLKDGSGHRDTSSIPDIHQNEETSNKKPAEAKRRRTIGVTLRLASLAGLSLSQYSMPETELSEEEKEDKIQLIAELAKLSLNERTKVIQQLTMSIEEKRDIRDQVQQKIGPRTAEKDVKIHRCTQLLYEAFYSLRRFREIMLMCFQSIHPWTGSLKVIGSKFGTGVLSYFTFLKWLLMFNLFSFLINFSFIAIPQFFDMGINNLTFTGLELLTGSGYFTKTIFYYGFYSNHSIQASPTAEQYNMQLAYFLTIGVYMLSCFLYLVFSMGKSFNESVVEVGILSGDAAKLLCSWDYNITNEKAVELKRRNLSTQLKEMLSDKMRYHRQLSTKQRILRYFIHFMSWIISLGTTYGCCLGIHSYSIVNFQNIWYYIYTSGRLICVEFLGKRANFRNWMNWLIDKLNSGEEFDPVKAQAVEFSLRSELSVADRPAKRNEPSKLWSIIYKDPIEEEMQKQAATLVLPIVVAIINLFIPLFFSFLGVMERFKYARHEIYILIIRNVLLKMSIIGVLCYYWLVTVASTVECWETFVGQDLYRLVVIDFIFSLLGSFFGEFIRSIMGTHCCRQLGVPEFDIARNVLGLIYAQTLAWIGLFFAPLLPAIQIIKFFIIFHVKKVSLMMNCQPPRQAWRASHMTTIFIFLLFFPGFLGVLCLLGVTVWKWKPSKHCGPFRGLSVPYNSISHFIHIIQGRFAQMFWLVWAYKNLIKNPLFYFLLTIIVFAIIYLYFQIIDGQKMMTKLLQEHISNEGKDKTYLLRKLNTVKLKIGSSKETVQPLKITEETGDEIDTESKLNLHFETSRVINYQTPRIDEHTLAEDQDRISEQDIEEPAYQSTREESGSALALAMAARHQAEDPNE
ncbi:transmembrane channel-like protein 5 isoform X2 [Scyliorhinus canicula]|uniref:transmembrane channel-like protein 5 isoform X2 n=1 Tax=Scyliorhinus canicula TaxID=7830 RepID=UPI0018F439FB|nr:transmembrane channel-like protein 5 isoform X2 [Scyliorhinus canicula]